MNPDDTPQRPTTLQDAIIGVDRDILRLLARRANLLRKLCPHGQRLDSATEKALRTAWERACSRMSNDPRLRQDLFTLMQEAEFLPKPREGEERRPAFNLAPTRRAVDVRLAAPADSRRARLCLTLAAISGSACRITPSLLGDADVEFIKMFNQLGTSLAWEDSGALLAREGGGLTLADKVVFVGGDALNFFLVLGQYLGHPSHAKFAGEGALKQCDLTAVRHFLPQLGARLTNVVPGSTGLPVRVECSGILPPRVALPADVPADMLLGLLLAQPFWPQAVTLEVGAHPDAATVLAEALPLLRECGVDVRADGGTVCVLPGPVRTPATPALPMELSLAAYLLALPCVAGGDVRLEGRWPDDTPNAAVAEGLAGLLRACGATVDANAAHARTHVDGELPALAFSTPLDASGLPPCFGPLALALAAVSALRVGPTPAPRLPASCNPNVAQSFLRCLGLECQDDGRITADAAQPAAAPDYGWSAPSPHWALALALVAFARPGIKLANPGIAGDLYPSWWSLYNALPCPERKQTPTEPQHDRPVRRRILAAEPSGAGSGNSPD